MKNDAKRTTGAVTAGLGAIFLPPPFNVISLGIAAGFAFGNVVGDDEDSDNNKRQPKRKEDDTMYKPMIRKPYIFDEPEEFPTYFLPKTPESIVAEKKPDLAANLILLKKKIDADVALKASLHSLQSSIANSAVALENARHGRGTQIVTRRMEKKGFLFWQWDEEIERVETIVRPI